MLQRPRSIRLDATPIRIRAAECELRRPVRLANQTAQDVLVWRPVQEPSQRSGKVVPACQLSAALAAAAAVHGFVEE